MILDQKKITVQSRFYKRGTTAEKRYLWIQDMHQLYLTRGSIRREFLLFLWSATENMSVDKMSSLILILDVLVYFE